MVQKMMPDVLGWHEADAVCKLQQMGWEVDVHNTTSRRRGTSPGPLHEVKRVVRCMERDGIAEILIASVIDAAK